MHHDAQRLKERILVEAERLKALAEEPSKELCRALHAAAVAAARRRSRDWVRWKFPAYAEHFANGDEIEPEKIRPRLVEVVRPAHADLFRLARLTWSLPFSKGFGRRLRFLIVDEANGKLMGILGLQSPPLDLPARDRLFDHPPGRKVDFVNQTMDVFTLGAVPPYGRLLGGKLVALAAASDEERAAYAGKYDGARTWMDKTPLPARLVALTSTSAFGRSSLYNRLKFGDRWIARSVGFTEGYGSFHLATLYPLMREYLEGQGGLHRGGFGHGPKIARQTSARTFALLGLPRELLKHGVKREVFLFPLIRELDAFMAGRVEAPTFYEQPFAELADWWRTRWLLPRARRVDGWHRWDRKNVQFLLLGQSQGKR